jgi:hypothetical protein
VIQNKTKEALFLEVWPVASTNLEHNVEIHSSSGGDMSQSVFHYSAFSPCFFPRFLPNSAGFHLSGKLSTSDGI